MTELSYFTFTLVPWLWSSLNGKVKYQGHIKAVKKAVCGHQFHKHIVCVNVLLQDTSEPWPNTGETRDTHEFIFELSWRYY